MFTRMFIQAITSFYFLITKKQEYLFHYATTTIFIFKEQNEILIEILRKKLKIIQVSDIKSSRS